MSSTIWCWSSATSPPSQSTYCSRFWYAVSRRCGRRWRQRPRPVSKLCRAAAVDGRDWSAGVGCATRFGTRPVTARCACRARRSAATLIAALCPAGHNNDSTPERAAITAAARCVLQVGYLRPILAVRTITKLWPSATPAARATPPAPAASVPTT